MVLEEQVTGDRWNGIGGRRKSGGSELTTTPFLLRGGDSVRGHYMGDDDGAVGAVSARNLAASLWKVAATVGGGGKVSWQYGLFDRLKFEGVTKWDFCNSKVCDDVSHSHSRVKPTSVASARQAELLKTKIKYRMNKVNEERDSWMITEQEKLCSIVNNLVDGVKGERNKSKKISTVNSNLLHDINEAKLSARKFMENLEKEKKARKLLEDECNELAKQVAGNKAEIGALKNQRKIIQDEVEQERKMLQIAEVWRQEQARMKILDAELVLQDKLLEIYNFMAYLEAFLRNTNLTTDVNVISQPKNIRHVFNPVYMLPESGNMLETQGRNADHCHYDQPHSASNIVHHINPSDQISSIALKISKKIESSPCKLERTLPRKKDMCKTILVDRSGCLSNRSGVSSTVTMSSPQRMLAGGGLKVRGNPHVIRAMKGYIEWPRGTQRAGLATKLDSKKMLLRNVLK